MTLTAIQIKNAKAKAKTYRLYDGNGLYCEVTAKGQKYWRYKYRYLNKEKRLALGVYPNTSLKDARLTRNQAADLLAKGVDPSAERQAKKHREVELHENSFARIAHEWHVKFYQDKEPGYAKRVWRALEKDIFPVVGSQPIGMITGPHLRKAILNIEARGAIESAHRALQICGRIYGYANACGYTEKDPTRGLKMAIAPPQTKHFAAITEPKEVGKLLRAIDGYEFPVVKAAMQIGTYTFVRPGELRKAEWNEFNVEDKVWRIPETKMKLRKPHIVPLANQVIDVIEELRTMTGNGQYLFPSVRSYSRCMSEATVGAALRRMGFAKEQVTGHGFRHMASTLLNEQGVWHPDAIERQLAHTDKSKVRGTYDHSKHLPERKKMMQAYADYLDSLKSSADVIQIQTVRRKV
ncbi:MAG: tyrosine-type recombinase/integrase [Gammaproteobacteria bacterium]|nr:tyrosine-type recombinase/integrase [Gammaproteobacteria bacterium]